MSTSDRPSPREMRTSFHSGLGLITLLGVLLVTLEHYLVLIDRPLMFPAGRLILGPLGVFLFLLLSGIHAAESTNPPGAWLMRRLSRIYPSFWIVLCVAFLAAWITEVQSFDVWQVLSQFLGTGFFTHADSLVLQPTWFISPLLVCYLIVFLFRSTGHSRLLAPAAMIGCAGLVWWHDSDWSCLSFLAFSIGYCLGAVQSDKGRAGTMLLVGILILGAVPFPSHSSKIGLACLLMAAGLTYRGRIGFLRPMTERSYEFYLVHRLAFFGALRYLQLDPITGGIVALFASAFLAELVFRSVQGLRRMAGKIVALTAASSCQTSRLPLAP